MGSTERDEAIEEAMTEPVKASGDTGSVEQRSIADLIAADEHLGAKAARRSRSPGGLQFFQIIPPGAHG